MTSTVVYCGIIDLENLKQKDLKLRLWGTVTRQSAPAYAVIEDTNMKEQNLYRKGDTVQNATVKMILREKIVLVVDNHDEILTMEKPVFGKRRFRGGRKNYRTSRLPASSYSRRITLNHQRLKSSMDNFGQVEDQAKLRPHVEDGRPAGISINRIKPKTIFRKLRLRNGDITQASTANGLNPWRTPLRSLKIYPLLQQYRLKSSAEDENEGLTTR